MPFSKEQRKQIFAERVGIHGDNYSDAFRAAYPHSKKWTKATVNNRASLYAKTDEVKIRIQELKARAKQKLISKFDMALTDTLSDLVNIARFDPLDLFNENGTVKDIQDIPQEARRVLTGLELGIINQVGAIVDGVEITKQVTFIQKFRQESRIQALGKILEYQLGELSKPPEDDEVVEETDLMQLARRIMHLVYRAHKQKELSNE